MTNTAPTRLRVTTVQLLQSQHSTGKPRAQDTNVSPAPFLHVHPTWAPAHLDHPSAWAMGKTLLHQTHPHGSDATALKRDEVRQHCEGKPCLQAEVSSKLGTQRDKTCRTGRGALGTCQPRHPASSLHRCPERNLTASLLRIPTNSMSLRKESTTGDFTSKTPKQLPAAPFKPATATCHTFPTLRKGLQAQYQL